MTQIEGDALRGEALFKYLDQMILRISPCGDIFLLRLLAALIPVILLAIDSLFGIPFFYQLGVPFYLFCLALYAYGLLKTLFLQRQVSAELLIVLVMAVTLIDGKPLSGALVAWFIGFGLYLSFTIIRRNREKIESLVTQTKTTALLHRGDAIREVPVKAVKQEDLLIIPSGTVIPVDGHVVEGRSSVDESFVTGEPFPVYKVSGDEVISGTLNLSAPLEVRAAKNGDESFLAVIAAEIETSLLAKPALQRKADTFVQFLLLGVSGYSFVLLFVTGSLDVMATALAVLCPCAWALATPTVFASGIGRSARLNILARGGEPLETLQAVKTVILDKTGTVTMAEPKVSRLIPLAIEATELIHIAASVETRFSHPLARAIMTCAREQGITRFKAVSEAEDLPGRGVKARVEGHEVLIGSPETLQALGLHLPAVEYSGRAIWLALDGEVKGVIVVQDVVRAAMGNLAAALRDQGIERVIVATGDHEESEAKRVADLIGADEYRFNCKPEDKANLVRQMQVRGKVAMVGDGVNDAPALAAADVGIAIGGHRNVTLAIASSDIVILGDDAGDLLTLLKISRKMAIVIRQNYAWAISFNAVGLMLATLGFLNPVLAAFLHHISSVFVVANAARVYVGPGMPARLFERFISQLNSRPRSAPTSKGSTT
ncbi:MAG: cadmium-translocating P-type ATPase [Nitrospirae bacterium]|nr:cadmium-translocating P-type ATPase [Nitrospirota bacterium]